MKDYIQQALKFESHGFNFHDDKRLLHVAMGLVTESGEFIDALKKSIYYGKELDRVNLKEELGDILWYVAVACDALGTDFETEMKRNIEKLQTRYDERYDESKATNRNLNLEREILENE